MSISSSLNAGVSGLNANANRLAAISDNIANSSTYGYKRVETDFHSMVVHSGMGDYTAGGVRTSTKRLVSVSGSLVTTSNPTDIAVRGRGFFPVTDLGTIGLDGTGYPLRMATTGSFRLDQDGLLRTSTGIVLMGWPANPDGSIPSYPRDTSSALEPIRVARNSLAGERTQNVTLGVNLPASDTVFGASGDPRDISLEYFDNLGMSRSLQITMTPAVPAVAGDPATNEWEISITDSASGLEVGNYTATFNDVPSGGGSVNTIVQNVGAGLSAENVATIDVGGPPATGQIQIDLGASGTKSGLSQLGEVYLPTGISKDGSAVGNMTGIEIDEGGYLIAKYDTGISQRLYQVPLLDVGNPNELVAMDNQTYAPSAESGAFFLWDAGDGPTGDLVSNALEGSTTDVAAELTNLIQTQRAYSSNAKVIQTVDEMLQETTNIKR